MSTRRDGLSLRTVDHTVRYLLSRHDVVVVGGNRRVLHLRRADGDSDVGAACSEYGFPLTRVLGLHGLTLRRRGDVTIVDLLECRDAETSARLAERVAARDEAEARAEWYEMRDRGETPPGRSADEHAAQVGGETYTWAITQTAPRLRSWIAAP